MANEELVVYIRAQMEYGASRVEITKILKLEGGWTDEDLLGAFAMAGNVVENLQPENLDNERAEEVVEETKDGRNNRSILEEAEIHKHSKKRNSLILPLALIIIIGLCCVGGFFVYKTLADKSSELLVVEEVVEDLTQATGTPEVSDIVHINEDKSEYQLIERDGEYYVRGKLELAEGVIGRPENIMNIPITMELFPIATDGTFEVLVLPDEMNIIGAMLPDKDFGFVKIMGPSDFESNPYALIDNHSSAVALVFRSPFLTSNDPDIAEPVLSVVRANEYVESFASVVEERSMSTDGLFSEEEYTDALMGAVESVLEVMNTPEEEEEIEE